MDKKNNSKKQHSKNMVKGRVSSKKMGMGNMAKVKKYATVDFMQVVLLQPTGGSQDSIE